ncbi:hypothetical protein SLA2020_131130 [Shorea laevis]
MDSVDTRDEEAPLIVDNLQSPTPKNHMRDVHVLSSAFLLIFLAYGAAQNLETTVNAAGDLGTISRGILYVSFMFFSLVASLVVRALGSKNALVLETSGYWLFIPANLKPSWYTMVPAFLYLGFAASIIWIGLACHARDYNSHEGAIIGKFNGVFWETVALHQFVGNLMSLALLRDGDDGSTRGTTLLFVVFLCHMTLGTILMCFLGKTDSKEEK